MKESEGVDKFQLELQSLFAGEAHSQQTETVTVHDVHRVVLPVLLVGVACFDEHRGLRTFAHTPHLTGQLANSFQNVTMILAELLGDGKTAFKPQRHFISNAGAKTLGDRGGKTGGRQSRLDEPCIESRCTDSL